MTKPTIEENQRIGEVLGELFAILVDGGNQAQSIVEEQGGCFFSQVDLATAVKHETLVAKAEQFFMLEAQKMALAINELDEFSVRDIFREFTENTEYILSAVDKDPKKTRYIAILYKQVKVIYEIHIEAVNNRKRDNLETMACSSTVH